MCVHVARLDASHATAARFVHGPDPIAGRHGGRCRAAPGPTTGTHERHLHLHRSHRCGPRRRARLPGCRRRPLRPAGWRSRPTPATSTATSPPGPATSSSSTCTRARRGTRSTSPVPRTAPRRGPGTEPGGRAGRQDGGRLLLGHGVPRRHAGRVPPRPPRYPGQGDDRRLRVGDSGGPARRVRRRRPVWAGRPPHRPAGPSTTSSATATRVPLAGTGSRCCSTRAWVRSRPAPSATSSGCGGAMTAASAPTN